MLCHLANDELRPSGRYLASRAKQAKAWRSSISLHTYTICGLLLTFLLGPQFLKVDQLRVIVFPLVGLGGEVLGRRTCEHIGFLGDKVGHLVLRAHRA